MSVSVTTEKSLFLEALEIETRAGRSAYLDQACGGDAQLRAAVEALIVAHERSLGLLDDTAAPSTGERPGSRIGPYKILQQIGEGGMGVVYMAEQIEPVHRKVALKVIKAGMDSRQVVARFEAERQALALMDHANIARVLDAGATDTGRPYFVMELVHGVPITKYCDDNRLSVRERLELFVPVCQAIQHAHQKGIIHRDIKPSNVMITLYDGKPVPKVIDFGVAKATEQKLTERTLFTQYGTLVGTLEYMSPEQAEMSALGADTRSDVYSLGVLLYELLTGGTPLSRQQIKEAPYDEVVRIIREDEPPKPSTRLSTSGAALATISAQRQTEPARLAKLVRGELDWIVMKCLEKDRNRRYDTATGLAADVQRYLSDEAVQACPPSALYRLGKFVRRNKAASAVGLAVLVALAVSATSTFVIAWQQGITAAALEAKTHATTDLELNLQRERVDAYFHRITLAHHALSTDNLGRALELLEKCPEDLRAWEWFYLTRLCRLDPLILRQAEDLNSLSFSPDGERLASAGGDGAIRIWNRKLELVSQIEGAHPGFVASVAFHPRRNFVASVGADRQVKVWDLTTGQAVFSRPCDTIHEYGTAYAAAFSPDGRQLVAGCDGAVEVWDWENDRLCCPPLGGHAKKGITVAFSRDGQRIASGSWSGDVLVWDAKTGERLWKLSEHRHPVTALAFSPDGRCLVSANFDGRLIVWDVRSGKIVRTLEAPGGLVMCVAYSPDGRRIASSALDKTVRVWDAASEREILVLRGHTGHCGCVAFSPDPSGWRLASASKDGTIRIWDATPPEEDQRQELATFEMPGHEIWTLAISPDGRNVASAGFNAAAKVWDTRSGKVVAQFPGHTHVVFCVAWEPTEGRRIASAGAEQGLFAIKVWDAQTGQQTFTFPDKPLPGDPEFFAVAFSPDGNRLVSGQADGTVKVWNAQTGAFIATLDDYDRVVRAVVFSPDGRHLASASGDGRVKLWDASRLEEPQEPRFIFRGRVPAMCLNIAFSGDGRLATAGEEDTVKIWDVQTGQELQTLRGHRGEVYTVAFSPDGRWVASGGEDSTVKVWDSRTGGAALRSFRGHTGLVSSVAFTPDSRTLISGSRDQTAKIWDVTPLEEQPSKVQP